MVFVDLFVGYGYDQELLNWLLLKNFLWCSLYVVSLSSGVVLSEVVGGRGFCLFFVMVFVKELYFYGFVMWCYVLELGVLCFEL